MPTGRAAINPAGRWSGAYCRWTVGRQPRACSRVAWQGHSTCVTVRAMSQSPLDQAFDRIDRALLRIERSVERGAMHRGRDDALRGKVASVVAHVANLIPASGAT